MDFYHVYNRGVEGRKIFKDKTDVARFEFSLQAFNNNDPIGGIFQLNLKKNLDIRRLNNDGRRKLVDVIVYCLNPTHYHLLIGVNDNNDLGNYLKRINGGYTKFFNHRHDRSGVLFQGKTKRKLIVNNSYLNYVAAYILGNREVHGLTNDDLGTTSFERGIKDKFSFNTQSFVKEAKILGKSIHKGRKNLQGLELEKI